eukprot:TRINITY_DN6839_c0_g1_i1.p1 TRINITY_DN6839_c0_g1~~TRINITY_DN6839_c0_g1_i1.p1  ORF type:complete len:409 (+),score=139.81 TRINITY_DN6839_c0_g1_i1:52-1278(+)
MKATVRITVRVGKRVIPMDVHPDDAVQEVTRRICKAEDLPAEFGTLLNANNDELDSWRTVQECDVRTGDTLKFKQQLKIRPSHSQSRAGSVCSLPAVHSRPCSSVSEGISSAENTPMRANSLQASSRAASLVSLSSAVPSKAAQEVLLKVKTSTGRHIKVHVNANDKMCVVMEKVRLHWTLTHGEHGISRIDDGGLEFLPRDATVDDCGLHHGAHVVLSTAPTPAEAYDLPAHHPPPTPHPHKISPIQRSDSFVRVKVGSGRVLKMRRYSYETLVGDLVDAVETRLGAVTSSGALASKNGSLFPSNLTLVQCGVLPGEIVCFKFPEPVPVAPIQKQAAQRQVSPSRTSSALSTVRFLREQLEEQHHEVPKSPLCQFTLCSLEPIFGAEASPRQLAASGGSVGSVVRYE